MDLSEAVVVTRSGELPNAERAAADVLVEEIEKRTGIRLPVTADWPDGRAVIALSATTGETGWARANPHAAVPGPEGFALWVQHDAPDAPVVWVTGADARGTLYGAGALLRNADWAQGRLRVPQDLELVTAPAYPIRGHQLGYRDLANSWDAWTIEQFDQYIRELALFGVNSVENIPFQDDRRSPLMKYSRREMNRAMSAICDRYGLDYWVFAPADFDLNDQDLRAEMLDKYEDLFRDCPRMNGVFFPGGDPGNNPPELVLPYLEDLAERLLPIHPDGRIWISLIWFNADQVDYVHEYIDSELPGWLGGLVADTSGPPIAETRKRLPARYQYRLYPDITHNKLSQFDVPWWDPAYALTLGREAINPRPVQYAEIINWYAPHSDGFITYSDGAHDDVNKVVWSLRGWDPSIEVRDIVLEYARLHFGPVVADDAADAILALEKNWSGPLATNGAVDGTLLLWQRLEQEAPKLAGNWRWQMNLLRAYYDAYTRDRLLYESRLETQANAILAAAPEIGADTAMKEALHVLNRAVSEPCRPEWLARIEVLCQDLFDSIGLQTSVPRYHAANGERGAVLDYVNFPLNNRYWLEDEFAAIAQLEQEDAKLARLETIRTWENPGPGSYYDDIGNIAKSPRVQKRMLANTDPEMRAIPTPTFWWWGDGVGKRTRLSWQWTMDWPEALIYEGLDPAASYTVRMTGYGQFLVRMNGERVIPPVERVEIGAWAEVPVPPGAVLDGKLVLTWDRPTDEGELNWRHQSRLAEVWLIKRVAP